MTKKINCNLKKNKNLPKCKKSSGKLKTFLVDFEEMPSEIKARNLNEAVKIAHMNLGVMEKD